MTDRRTPPPLRQDHAPRLERPVGGSDRRRCDAKLFGERPNCRKLLPGYDLAVAEGILNALGNLDSRVSGDILMY